MSIQPKSYQIEHYNKLLQFIQKNKFYIDKSKPGSGKSYPPFWIANKLKLKLFVVCPLSTIERWKEVSEEAETDIEMYSYTTLRSVKGKQPKHELLSRIDYPNNVIFKSTDKLDKYIKKGYLFVFDECHMLKNKSDQWKACKTITNQILKSTTSKFCLLSGSLFDKPEHANQLLELIGFITKPLYYIINNELETDNSGIEEILLKSRTVNKEKTIEIGLKYNFDKRNVNKLVDNYLFELFKILDDTISSSMISNSETLMNHKQNPITTNIINHTNIILDVANIIANYLIEDDRKNGLYLLDSKEEENEMIKILNKLQKAIGYNPEDNRTTNTFSIRAITKYLREVELLKKNIFVKIAKQKLSEDPTGKIVIFLNYVDTIEYIAEELKKFKPIIFYGKTKNRDEKIELFNKNKKHRVIIANTQVAAANCR